MSESRVRENRMHGSMRRREATRPVGKCRAAWKPPADPTDGQRRRPLPSGESGSQERQ